MPKTKKHIAEFPAIKLLKSFSEEEVYGFAEFINSGYYNTNKKIVLLYNSLIKFYPDFENEKLNREYVWKEINNKKKLSDDELRVYLSLLQNLILDYLRINNFEKNDFQRQMLLLKELSKRNQYDLFTKRRKKLNDSEELLKEGNANYIKLHSLNSEHLSFVNKNFKILKLKHAEFELKMINEVCINLSNYYITELIRGYVKLYNNSTKFEYDNSKFLLNDLLDLFNLEKMIQIYKSHGIDCFILELYKKLIEFYKDMNIKHYYDYKKIVEKNLKKIEKEELNFHFSNMISYCIRYSRTIKPNDLLPELFDLYNKYIDHKIFEDGESIYLNVDMYRNIFFTSLTLKKSEWAEKFVNTALNYVNPVFHFNLFSYSNAILANFKNDFRKSLDYILKVDMDSFIYKHDLNILKLKNYYCLNDFIGLIDLVHAHTELIRTDKILPKDFSDKYLRFLYYLEKLVVNNSNEAKLDFLLHKLKKEDFFYKNWLLERYNERLNQTV